MVLIRTAIIRCTHQHENVDLRAIVFQFRGVGQIFEDVFENLVDSYQNIYLKSYIRFYPLIY